MDSENEIHTANNNGSVQRKGILKKPPLRGGGSGCAGAGTGTGLPRTIGAPAVSLNVVPEDYIVEDELFDQDEVQNSFANDLDNSCVVLGEDDDDKPLIGGSGGSGDGGEDGGELGVVISPSDKYWIVFAVFYFLGLTTLLPWNFFINADKYWMYKFRDVNSTSANTTNLSTWFLSSSSSPSYSSNPHGKTEFQASFTSYLAIASNVPATLCFVLNMFIAKYISAKKRMICALAVTLAFFASQTVLVRVNTDSWQLIFLRITLLTCVFMNSFCSLFQCGLFAVIGKFPHAYTTATMSGQALGGVFAAVANILSIVLAADQVTSAFIYFCLGSASLLISFLIVSFLLPRLLFYRFHVGEKSVFRWIENYPPEAMIQPDLEPNSLWPIFKKVWLETVTAALTFLVTLTALPALLVLVVSENVPSVWNDKYFVGVAGFLSLAIGDYLGRIVSGFTQWPRKNSWSSLVLGLLRIGMLPLLMLCNLHPRRQLPVFFTSDFVFGLFTYLFGFGNGYLCNLVFINAPQLVERDEQEDANSIVTMGLGLGLSLGVTLSYFVIMAL